MRCFGCNKPACIVVIATVKQKKNIGPFSDQCDVGFCRKCFNKRAACEDLVC